MVKSRGHAPVTESGVLDVARAVPAVEPPPLVPAPAGVDPAGRPIEYVVDTPTAPAAAGIDVPPPGGGQLLADLAEDPGILIHASGFTGIGQRRVLSMWNSADPAGLLASALRELHTRGYFTGGGDERAEESLALAGALLISVAAFEAARLSQPALSLEGVDMILGALLDREPVPEAAALSAFRDLGEAQARRAGDGGG